MFRDTANVEPEMYDCTSNNWSHWNGNEKLKEKLGRHARETFHRFSKNAGEERPVTGDDDNNNNNNNNNNLCIEVQRMWNLKCTIVPVIIGATGIVMRSLKKNLELYQGNIQ